MICPHCSALNMQMGADTCWQCGHPLYSMTVQQAQRLELSVKDALLALGDPASGTGAAAAKRILEAALRDVD